MNVPIAPRPPADRIVDAALRAVGRFRGRALYAIGTNYHLDLDTIERALRSITAHTVRAAAGALLKEIENRPMSLPIHETNILWHARLLREALVQNP